MFHVTTRPKHRFLGCSTYSPIPNFSATEATRLPNVPDSLDGKLAMPRVVITVVPLVKHAAANGTLRKDLPRTNDRFIVVVYYSVVVARIRILKKKMRKIFFFLFGKRSGALCYH